MVVWDAVAVSVDEFLTTDIKRSTDRSGNTVNITGNCILGSSSVNTRRPCPQVTSCGQHRLRRDVPGAILAPIVRHTVVVGNQRVSTYTLYAGKDTIDNKYFTIEFIDLAVF